MIGLALVCLLLILRSLRSRLAACLRARLGLARVGFGFGLVLRAAALGLKARVEEGAFAYVLLVGLDYVPSRVANARAATALMNALTSDVARRRARRAGPGDNERRPRGRSSRRAARAAFQ